MNNNDLRALITQEITRAQLIEALKTGKQKNAGDSAQADKILDDYTVLVQGLAMKANISLQEATRIISESIKNKGVLINSESLKTLDENWLKGLGKAVGSFYRGIGDVFDPPTAKKAVPDENELLAALERAQQGEQVMQLLRQMLLGVKAADEAEESGNPEEEAAEDKVVAGIEDAIEDIDDQLPDGELPPVDGQEGGEGAPEGEEGEAAAEGPVPLFKGDGALYSRLFSSIRDRLKTDPNYGELAGDKQAIGDAVKSILKDLSAQLRANGIKVTESQVPLLSALIAERIRSGRYNIISERDTSLGGGALPGVTDAGGGQAGPSDDEIRKKEKKQKFQPGGNATQKPTGKGGRVKPVKGQVSAGQAVAGKIHNMIAQQLGAGSPDDMKQIRRDTQKMVTTIITKMVKPFLEKYLAGKDIKLKEGQFSDLTILLTDKVLTEAIKRRQLRK
tara:strand:- start:7213 stop:8559 length:1347 start_codon:yes stop_codon:yes gene_type:complete